MQDLSFDNIILFKCFHCWELNVTSIYAFSIYPEIIHLMIVLFKIDCKICIYINFQLSPLFGSYFELYSAKQKCVIGLYF